MLAFCFVIIIITLAVAHRCSVLARESWVNEVQLQRDVTMDRPHQTTTRTSKHSGVAAADATILIWEDDPDSGHSPVPCPAPQPEAAPLAFTFPKPGYTVGHYDPQTPQFRYWVAVEALRRGAGFWAAHSGPAKWQPGPKLAVLLDEGMDLNAYYDRKALNFFHGAGAGKVVYSGESGDVLCHEMGHAILDAIKPQLWGAASHEAAAFHESFGDMSAILSALQVPSLRHEVLAETGGNLCRNSRLSRLAEQLGSAIRARSPDAVDPDCLRNAANSFSYQDPMRLPARAPAAQLSSEPHSFSRVFTGAFLEGLAGMASARAASGQVTEADLLAAAGDMADILVAGSHAGGGRAELLCPGRREHGDGKRAAAPRLLRSAPRGVRAPRHPVPALGCGGRGAAHLRSRRDGACAGAGRPRAVWKRWRCLPGITASTSRCWSRRRRSTAGPRRTPSPSRLTARWSRPAPPRRRGPSWTTCSGRAALTTPGRAGRTRGLSTDAGTSRISWSRMAG